MQPSTEQLRSIVEAAIRAPSSHNTQPWYLSTDDNRIELWADRTRALPVKDPNDRELTISCGAALFNLEIAARANGLTPRVSILPDATASDLMARVSLEEPTEGKMGSPELVDAIESRHTTRDDFTSIDDVAGLTASLATCDGRTRRSRVLRFGR